MENNTKQAELMEQLIATLTENTAEIKRHRAAIHELHKSLDKNIRDIDANLDWLARMYYEINRFPFVKRSKGK